MARNSNRARLFPLLQAIILIFVGGLFLGGLFWWRQSTTQPRTNVLILGLDRRPEEGYVVRSDVMILLTVYPSGPRVGALSIPRDLYVGIPGYGAGRINTAHFWGEAYGVQTEIERGGLALAMRTVTQNFGVPVHHYVRVDFEGFEKLVDAIGGITIDVEEAIYDDEYPDGNPNVYVHSHRYRDADAHSHRDTNSYRDADTHSHSDTYSYRYSNPNPNPNTHSHPGAAAGHRPHSWSGTDPRRGSRTRALRR